MKRGWYVHVYYDQSGYGPEFGDENPDDIGPFNTKEEAEDAAFRDWDFHPWGHGDPYFVDGDP